MNFDTSVFDTQSLNLLFHVSQDRELANRAEAAARLLVDHLDPGQSLQIITFDGQSMAMGPTLQAAEDPAPKEAFKGELLANIAGFHDARRMGLRDAFEAMAGNDALRAAPTLMLGQPQPDEGDWLEMIAASRDAGGLGAQRMSVVAFQAHRSGADPLEAIARQSGGEVFHLRADASRFEIDRLLLHSVKTLFGQTILLEDTAFLFPRQTVTHSFTIGEMDSGKDISLLAAQTADLTMTLTRPDGEVITPFDSAPRPDIAGHLDQGHMVVRLKPSHDRAGRSWFGRWSLELASHVDHKVDYYLQISSRSALNFQSTATQEEGQIVIRTATHDLDQVEHLLVTGTVTHPSGETSAVTLEPAQNDSLATRLEATQPGAYAIDLVLHGIDALGGSFDRKAHLTLSVQ